MQKCWYSTQSGFKMHESCGSLVETVDFSKLFMLRFGPLITYAR